MIYVDNARIMWRGKRLYHMTADSLDELHQFAHQIGVARCWFHAASRHPHYDITGVQRVAALDAGAEAVGPRELVTVAKRLH